MTNSFVRASPPRSSGTYHRIWSGKYSEAGPREEPSRVDGLHECRVVTLVLVGVRGGEVGDGPVECVAFAEVRADGDPIAPPGVGPCERRPADLRVVDRAEAAKALDVGRPLPVVELADVVVAGAAVETRDPLPAQEDVAGPLHESLTDHHPLAVVGNTLLSTKRSRTDSCASLTCRNRGSSSSRPTSSMM